MNDEIKEILDALEVRPEEITMGYSLILTIKQQKVLLDYITNLQQENEKLNGVIETLKETNKLLIHQKYKLEFELDKLDERIDKAIEYISDNTDENDYLFLLPSQVSVLSSILQGDSNE